MKSCFLLVWQEKQNGGRKDASMGGTDPGFTVAPCHLAIVTGENNAWFRFDSSVADELPLFHKIEPSSFMKARPTGNKAEVDGHSWSVELFHFLNSPVSKCACLLFGNGQVAFSGLIAACLPLKKLHAAAGNRRAARLPVRANGLQSPQELQSGCWVLLWVSHLFEPLHKVYSHQTIENT